MIPNLLANGKAYLGDFASVDPARLTSIQSGWFTRGVAAVQRYQEKPHSYQGFYDPAVFEMVPLILESTGRMHPGFKRFFTEVATFASKHLPTGGVGEQRFRSRFLQLILENESGGDIPQIIGNFCGAFAAVPHCQVLQQSNGFNRG
jgi:hypothetical protein